MWFSSSKPEPEPPFFLWSPADYSVGISFFDNEHMRLAELMTEFHAKTQGRYDRNVAQRLMENLFQETRAHFAHEERTMEEAEYQDLAAHGAEHAALIGHAQDLLRQYKGGSLSAMALPNLLKAWLIPHIHEWDRKYAASMRRKGIH